MAELFHSTPILSTIFNCASCGTLFCFVLTFPLMCETQSAKGQHNVAVCCPIVNPRRHRNKVRGRPGGSLEGCCIFKVKMFSIDFLCEWNEHIFNFFNDHASPHQTKNQINDLWVYDIILCSKLSSASLFAETIVWGSNTKVTHCTWLVQLRKKISLKITFLYRSVSEQ